jgi:hypothetical protein
VVRNGLAFDNALACAIESIRNCRSDRKQ